MTTTLTHEPAIQKMLTMMLEHLESDEIEDAEWYADEIDAILGCVFRFLSGEHIMDACVACDEDEPYKNSAHCICDGCGCMTVALPLY